MRMTFYAIGFPVQDDLQGHASYLVRRLRLRGEPHLPALTNPLGPGMV